MRLYRKSVTAGIVVCLALAAASVSAQGPQLSADPQALDAFIAQRVKDGGLVGLSVAVMIDGNVVIAKGYGLEGLDARRPVEPASLFAVGSITKQFTCACVLKLAEDGKLSVYDSVARYYPNLTRAKDITILDLMNHVSGYPDYYPLDFVDRRMQKPIAEDELIRQYATAALDFEPGTRYSYSNTGYVILGRIVEKVSGEPFGKFLDRRVLKPLGLAETAYEPDLPADGYARGYVTFALGDPEAPVPEARGWIAAAGAIYASARDLAKWDLALMEGRALRADSFKLMTSPRRLADGGYSNYGCGLSIGQRGGVGVLSHNGAVAGFYALNAMIPSTKSAVVVLSNLDSYGAVDEVFVPVFQALAARSASANAIVPKIAGPPALEVSKEWFKRLQTGDIDRGLLGEEFSLYLSDARVRSAQARLGPFGQPTRAEVQSVAERGGMEVSRVLLVFPSGSLRTLMYRTPDGRIQQFFVMKD